MLTTEDRDTLTKAGINEGNFGRLQMFMEVDRPTDEAFEDVAPTDSVVLTVGQVNRLRGSLRFAFQQFLAGVAMKAAAIDLDRAGDMDQIGLGAVMDVDYDGQLEQFLALDDILANLVAGVEADAVTFTVPDALPDDPEIWDMDPADFTEVDEAKSEQDTTLD